MDKTAAQNTKIRDVAILGSSSLAIGLLILYVLFLRPMGQWQEQLRSTVGKSESHALAKLGSPRHTIRKHDNLASSFAGYVPAPNHPVENKVLVYDYLNLRGYLFINRAGIVEHVSFAGT